MWDSCFMTWKTFLELFKADYSLFYYDGEDWYFKCSNNNFGNIQINLQWTEIAIRNGEILFLDHSQIAANLISMEEPEWNNIKKNIINY